MHTFFLKRNIYLSAKNNVSRIKLSEEKNIYFVFKIFTIKNRMDQHTIFRIMTNLLAKINNLQNKDISPSSFSKQRNILLMIHETDVKSNVH